MILGAVFYVEAKRMLTIDLHTIQEDRDRGEDPECRLLFGGKKEAHHRPQHCLGGQK
jgi:hypothetical protein